MKKIILLALSFLVVAAGFSQVRTTTRGPVVQGNYVMYPGSYSPTAASPNPAASQMDTLQVSDTVAYVIYVNHTNDVDIFHQWYWSKSGSGTAAITLSFLQSNDNVNFTPVTKGVAQGAYTKTYSLSASGWNFVSFAADTAVLRGRYIKVQYKTDATASVGGKVFSFTKTTIR